MQAIRKSGVRLRGDVLVASVQGEEDGGLGTYALLDRGWTADACVIPEGRLGVALDEPVEAARLALEEAIACGVA